MKNFAFFGTSRFSVIVLDDLKNKFGITPSLLVTQPDKPKGRKQIMTAPEAKTWAQDNGVKIFQPADLKSEETKNELKNYDFFLVASYGKIVPNEILNLPKNGCLNVHPSLLPKYRGASPIQSQIQLGEKNIGVSIIEMDEELDHGPIITQAKVNFDKEFPGTYEEVEEILAHRSAELLNESLTKWQNREITSLAQNHHEATFTKILDKNDGEIKLEDDSKENYRKYLAYHHWPKVFFYTENDGIKKRNIITEATFENNQFKIVKIIPEGKKETFYKLGEREK